MLVGKTIQQEGLCIVVIGFMITRNIFFYITATTMTIPVYPNSKTTVVSSYLSLYLLVPQLPLNDFIHNKQQPILYRWKSIHKDNAVKSYLILKYLN